MTNNELTNKDGLTYAASTKLDGATHAFLGRSGGVSLAPFASLNTGRHVNDDPKDAEENRGRIKKTFGVENDNLVIVNQVHGTKVLNIEDTVPPEMTEADAIITARTGIAIAVQTADCVPILLFEPDKKIIGAVHAGWRGTLDNIAAKTIGAMAETFDIQPSKIRAAIGPSIGSCCYEVSEDITGRFSNNMNYENNNAAIKGRHIDLPIINRIQLQEAGLASANIETIDICTACRSDIFFSHRKEGGRTGRQLSLIMNV